MSTDTLYIGRNVDVSGGTQPYTYSWSCEPQEQGLKMVTASDLLSDTTIANPYFKWSPSKYKFPLYLKVTDAKGNIAIDSLYLLWETFTQLTDGNDDLVEKIEGNKIYLTGEQPGMSCLFPPMSYFAIIESDTIALPAYVTIQESDSVTIFGIDSIGCYDYPRKELGKWLLVSDDEMLASEDAVKLFSNSLVFNSTSQKQIYIYSTTGQLLYSKNTADTRFNIPSFNNINHCVCRVIVNNKSYSFHLLKP